MPCGYSRLSCSTSNRRRIRASLPAKVVQGHAFRIRCDQEKIAESYKVYRAPHTHTLTHPSTERHARFEGQQPDRQIQSDIWPMIMPTQYWQLATLIRCSAILWNIWKLTFIAKLNKRKLRIHYNHLRYCYLARFIAKQQRRKWHLWWITRVWTAEEFKKYKIFKACVTHNKR